MPKRTLTPAARRKIGEAVRRRWAKIHVDKKAEAERVEPTLPFPVLQAAPAITQTRIEVLKASLSHIEFPFSIYFTDENGQRMKYYQGAQALTERETA